EVGIEVPVVVRLEGTRAAEGRQLLDESGLNLHSASDLGDAAEKIVSIIGANS
ncbi:MAG: succinate--CoA ligase subunit beta, partial [Gammaproteobacteria bacterium]